MSPIELLQHCIDTIERWKTQGLPGTPFIQLTMQKNRPPTGDTVRLFGTRGPKGDICLVRPHQGGWKVVATFPAASTAAWIGREAQRAVAEMEGSVADR